MSQIITIGFDELPSHGALILPNRLEFSHLLHLEKELSGRQILYLAEDGGAYDGLTQTHLEKEGTDAVAFAIDEPAPEELLQIVGDHIKAGGMAVFVPGKVTERRATTQTVRPQALEVLTSLNVPVIPAFVETPRNTVLATESTDDYPEAILVLGEEIPADKASPAAFLENVYISGEAAYATLPVLKKNLARVLLEGLKRHANNAGLIDGMDGSELAYGRILAASLALAGELKKQTQKERVAIILPPGRAGLIANLAVVFANKVPVNLNFTAGAGAVESAIRQADVDKFITVDKFVRKMQAFPWPPTRDLIFLERLLPSLKGSMTRWFIASKFLSAEFIANRLQLPKKGGDREAVLLFTSGSSGEPKGVALSHRNVLANVNQFGARLDLHHEDSVLGCLPLFHSFGCTVTLWYPVIEGLTLVTYPSPAETVKLAELIEQHKVSLLVATPTFLRGYLRRAKPEQLESLKLVVTGAEKLPATLRESFAKRFGKEVLEGYGLTETSPVTNVNLPDPTPKPDDQDLPVLPTARAGSVGHMVQGLAIRITDPATDEPLPIDQPGIIWFKGANVFGGYLNKPETNAEILQDGWLRTGDIGRLDHDGFLYIEGRLSRFSKIGGEMVPHERVEELIVQALGLENQDERCVTVVGLPDEQKGEQLVLLSTVSAGNPGQEIIDLRYRLLEMKVPSLWIPKTMIPVNEIPLLASGKLDIRGCEAKAKGE
ncbi:AMP-binding protein [Sulfuriroseicoccus oceanibius]|uniref:AMP-binding protein n=1 Tax=Sulfuriroseicoccus oceanibius TaxID=2707525 RepID=A0A6B3LDF1_9BACT|nr:AMP-binding protein [Sulfuriroseicoccus oceanibius]QQL45048.1 AMP-binding protein [Sulfuriroseicoccus oceanibius]